tara:strand:- start:274 stop:432 length:159 start_codon:yes stop_codon:yes gene_type:complete
MAQGTLDLLILLIIFLGLQAWWIYPILKNKQIDINAKNLKEEVENLERLYKR